MTHLRVATTGGTALDTERGALPCIKHEHQFVSEFQEFLELGAVLAEQSMDTEHGYVPHTWEGWRMHTKVLRPRWAPRAWHRPSVVVLLPCKIQGQ
jgi:hypothetical protein